MTDEKRRPLFLWEMFKDFEENMQLEAKRRGITREELSDEYNGSSKILCTPEKIEFPYIMYCPYAEKD